MSEPSSLNSFPTEPFTNSFYGYGTQPVQVYGLDNLGR